MFSYDTSIRFPAKRVLFNNTMDFPGKFKLFNGIIPGMMTDKIPTNEQFAFKKPASQLIEERFSCRTYLPQPIEYETCEKLHSFNQALPEGPFGNRVRFKLVSAVENDGDELKSLGTYGFIRGATGFVIGAVKDAPNNLEDFGYLMESIVLYAADLDLGTCWLGGTFTKSSFARRMGLLDGESIPAVLSTGYIANKRTIIERLTRTSAKADRRIPWEKLFFDGSFLQPLTKAEAGEFAHILEMVRRGPSASNQQPWRVVRDGDAWHFFLQRTPGYRERYVMKLLSIADMQRLDMGIAMFHFELAAAERGFHGHWVDLSPEIDMPDELINYLVSWVPIAKV